MTRLLPHPILSVVVALVWVALANSLTLGHLLLGTVLGVVIPLYTRRYWPERVTIKRPWRVVEYLAIVGWDLLVSNVQVAGLILFRSGPKLHSVFVSVPLELRTPEAVTVLTGTITLTPGTVSADLSADGRAVLVHCLDAADPDAVVRTIKTRYERRLKDIFE
jgi:multicomponent K+:H+ antiporter subunit E